MKLYIVYKTDILNYRERSCVDATCSHVPLFACSWQWLAKLVRPFVGGEYVMEALEGDYPKREPVIDSTTSYILHGPNKGLRMISNDNGKTWNIDKFQPFTKSKERNLKLYGNH